MILFNNLFSFRLPQKMIFCALTLQYYALSLIFKYILSDVSSPACRYCRFISKNSLKGVGLLGDYSQRRVDKLREADVLLGKGETVG